LAHESSSLCSFQGSRCRLNSRSPCRHRMKIRQRNVRVRTLKAEQYSFMSRASPRHYVKDLHSEGRAADAENIRPFNLIPP
jgi:hypothetical protein